MIETSTAYKVGDKIFATFKEAQLDALTAMFGGSSEIANALIEKKDSVLAILTMGEPAKRGRKPRSDQVGKHAKKKAKSAQEPSEPSGPGVKIEASEKYQGT